MNTSVIGIDVGTSGCRVVAIDTFGKVIASHSASYPLQQPQASWSEQNPTDWWDGVCRCLVEVRKALGDTNIAGISLCGQMHGMVALDAANNVIRPAILWNDQRSAVECDEITKAAGGLEQLLSYTDNMMLTGFTASKVLWYKKHEPDNFHLTRTFLNPKDYIRFLLTGVLVTDLSDASGTGLFDVSRRSWAWELIDRCGFSRELFPDCLESVEQAGVITASVAAQTGIPPGAPVYAGGGDAVLSTLAMGLVDSDAVGITLGTSGVVAAALPGYTSNPGGLLQVCCGNAENLWVAFGCTLSAAGSYEWFRELMGKEESYLQLDTLAAEVPPGSEGLLFTPYLTGERCPHFDPLARGSFVGINLAMHKGHLARAVLEGVAFSLKQVYDLMLISLKKTGFTEIRLAGGGAQSTLWRQILADIFATEVKTIAGSDQGGAFAAALIAGVGAKIWSSLYEAQKLIGVANLTHPQPDNFNIYKAQYERYCRVYEALRWI